ncbi:MAG: DUF87 domain-containing protein [Campylobacter sp.]|nr:DUF87 domain-containing protein [Campylobacter sp.]
MKNIQENLKLFYVGIENDEPFFYKNKDLTTHAAIIGMTGSGKTGLGISLLEEACIDNIPCFIIDPKGDLSNLCLSFENFNQFLPYMDENEAQNKGLSIEEMAQEEAKKWQKGIQESFQDPSRVGLFKNSANFTIYTPKSTSGVGVALLSNFNAPKIDDEEAFSNYINSLSASVLSLLGDSYEQNSKEQILIAKIFESKFAKGENLSIQELIGLINEPPFSKIGVFDLASFYPSQERLKLAISLNSLIASPGFKLYTQGEKLDISNMLFDANGKAKCNIFSLSHLDDADRMFFVTLLLNEMIAWMRSIEGTSSLRAILYMDEIYGFFPPNANPPSKAPMLTLLKQARAFGLGCILSTQNPVDLDYKGLSNIGTWFIGRLQTAQDKARVIDGLTGISGSQKSELESLISNLDKRNFLLKNINDDKLHIIKTRWALSYLKGPLSKEQISNLMSEKKQNIQSKTHITKSVKPIISTEIDELYASQNAELSPYVFANVKARFYDAKKGIDETKDINLLYELGQNDSEVKWDEASVNPPLNLCDAPKNASYAELPSFITSFKNTNELKKQLKDYIYRNEALCLYSALGINSMPNETKEQFFVRLQDKCNEILEEKTEEITQKFQKEKVKLEERLNKAIAKYEKEQQDVKTSGINAVISIGASLLGAFFGSRSINRTSISKVATGVKSAGRVLKERGDVKLSEESINELNAKIEELMQSSEDEISHLKDSYDIQKIAVDELRIKPKKSDIFDEKVALLWK